MIELWMKRETEEAWPNVHVCPVRRLRVGVVVGVLLSMVVSLVAGAAVVERVQDNAGRCGEGVAVRGKRVQRIVPVDCDIRLDYMQNIITYL